MEFVNRKRFAKSHKPTHKPKLGGSVCLPHRTTDRQSTRKTEGQQLTAVTVAQHSFCESVELLHQIKRLH